MGHVGFQSNSCSSIQKMLPRIERGMAHQEQGRRTAAERDFARAKRMGYTPLTPVPPVPPNGNSVVGNNNFAQAPTEPNAIESRIDGTFEGWDGVTVIKLTDRQIWQQASFNYEYHYAYRPEVVIYRTGNVYKMNVERTRKAVQVIRLKESLQASGTSMRIG